MLAAVIEQAVHDRRLALTLRLIDDDTNPAKNLKSKDAEIVMNLYSFFESGGLEAALDIAGFKISTIAIRSKASERIEGRERG
jgi:hypothetical protein|tara:strand:- start:445 stop:693 length:249 start_codon:yes stop_codon:yes gene_type:complete